MFKRTRNDLNKELEVETPYQKTDLNRAYLSRFRGFMWYNAHP